MSFIAKLAASMKSFDRRMWPDHRVALSPRVAEVLARHRLVVADVGSADGPEEKWSSLAQYIHFLTFEPNPRPAQAGSSAQVTNFTVGLWSSKGSKALHVTGHPDSSSLLPINSRFFADYLSQGGMEVVDQAMIELDTLDHLLANRAELLPDFLKIDVEGGELEVLKGAETALARSVIGLKVETAFVELQLGRPLFGEIDAFLRERGFVLFHLGRNHWIRKNGLRGYSSQPQVIWGDAIYFLSREKFLERLAAAGEEKRPALLARFVVLLLRHGVHDYAWDLIEASAAGGWVAADFAAALKGCVLKSLDTSVWYFVKSALGLAFALAVFVPSLFSAEARKRGGYYVKQRAGRLFHDLERVAALEGRTHNACIGDPFV